MLRVVVDTNHVVSAILSGRGASAKLIDWMTREEDCFRLLLSEAIWSEYTTVTEWLNPSSMSLERDRVLDILREQAEWVVPTTEVDACPDAADNHFLACAVDGNADCLVTKNIRHFPRKTYAKVKIVRISMFLRILEEREAVQKS